MIFMWLPALSAEAEIRSDPKDPPLSRRPPPFDARTAPEPGHESVPPGSPRSGVREVEVRDSLSVAPDQIERCRIAFEIVQRNR